MMKEQAAAESSSQERQLVALLRKLPPERSAQVFAFARFVAYETFKTDELELFDVDEFLEDADTENDAKWEAIFASDEGQTALDRLADEALAEIHAGKAKPMIFTASGEITPG
ncbi:MAG: hypothetical protein R3C14_17645 [Caldilineaceae bacterium]